MNSDNDNQGRFQDRLSRIQDKHAEMVERDELRQPEKRKRRRSGGGKGRGTFLAVVAIPALVAGVGFAYVKFPEKFSLDAPRAEVAEAGQRVKLVNADKPEKTDRPKLASLFAGLGGAAPVTSLAGDPKPEQGGPREMTAHGPILHSPLVLTADGAEVQIASVASGVAPPADGAAPARITAFDRQSECSFRRPAGNEKVVGVNVSFAQADLPVVAFSDIQAAEALNKSLQQITVKGEDTLTIKPYDGTMRGIDVFVTDRSGPLYLVLQTLGRATIWNVHAAPGVEIAHVAMIGERVTGLMAPEGTPHQALIAGDFVKERGYGADDSIRPCMVVPWRARRDDWPAQQKANKGNLLYVNQMESFAKGRGAYAAWYKDAFGIGPDINEVAGAGAAHVLVGPVPDQPLPYRALDGAALSLMRSDHVFTGTDEERAAQVDQFYGDLLAAAVNGDVAILRPEPALRETEVGQ